MRLDAAILLLFAMSSVPFLSSEPFPNDEVWALSTFKESIFEDPHLVLSDWNNLDADPCNWSGIGCSFMRDHVVKINISGSSIRGFIPPELGRITFLQELLLHGNNLIGTIPKEVGMLKFLKDLDLGENQLTGPIPPELANMTSVTKINLQSNGLTGHLPSQLGNLKNLRELRLDRNKLQGTIPAFPANRTTQGMYTLDSTGLCRASQLQVVNLSYNFFVGTIPKCLNNLPSTNFQWNCLKNKNTKQLSSLQCGGAPQFGSQQIFHPKKQPADDAKAKQHQEPSKPGWLLALEIVTATIFGSIFVIAILTSIRRCNTKSSLIIPWKKSASQNEQITVHIDSELLKNVACFSRQELEIACEEFSNIIGSSPDSLVYKGTMKGGPEIAVISLCVKEENWTGDLELYFHKEVADLARLNHENTGKLLGYCKESSPFSRMLVFEYTPNGTLYEHLHYGEGCQLSWTRRMKIVIGIARGLKYLHTQLAPPFTVSELNSSSVYLTEDFSSKLVDFESWKSILARSEKNSGSIGSRGDICVLPDSLDVKGNVYSFGVLLLEIISGRPPFCKETGCLIDWAKEYLEMPEVMAYVVDPKLKQFEYEDLEVICEVVNLCINPEPAKRPSMGELCNMLESKIETNVSFEFGASSLEWAELALSS